MWCVLEERRNGDYMKKIAIAVLSAVCVFALAGCADDVTMDNEQNDIVAEYIAGTLLRHSYANEWKYSKLSNPTFNKSGQSTTTTGKNNTSTTGTTQAGIKAASITEALGLSGVTVSYKKVSVGNRYPTDAYAVCVPADSGCKVVAVEFTIKNTGSAVYNATTKSANVTMKLSAGSGTYTQYKSMLKNDICNLDKVTINAGEEYTAAAVFQVSTTDAGASGMKLEVLSGTQQVETINLQ